MLSINLGVFGLLNLWGVDLDPISMITILMSIGFSVDFTCHMSYHYYKSEVREPTERLTDALVSIGWPMVQAGMSTLLGVLVLAIPNSYMSMTFIKTASLVIILGLLHGLLILPVVLTSLPACLSASSTASSTTSSASSDSGHCLPCRPRLCPSPSSSLRTIPSPQGSSPSGTILPRQSRLHRALTKGLSLPTRTTTLKPPLSPTRPVVTLSHRHLAPAKSL